MPSGVDLYVGGVLAAILFTQTCVAQSKQKEPPLCVLERKAIQGSRAVVQVAGIYSLGLDMGILTDENCATEPTWVELDLQSKHNKEKLRRLLDRSGQAYVVFQGEFYGSQEPDSKLPEAIRKVYHPGWGHLGAFRTKLVVHEITSVRAAPRISN